MKNILLQAFLTYWQDVMDMYQQVSKRPFGYIVLDLNPAGDYRIRVLSHFLTHEEFLRCYKKERSGISILKSTSIDLAHLKQAILGETWTRE